MIAGGTLQRSSRASLVTLDSRGPSRGTSVADMSTSADVDDAADTADVPAMAINVSGDSGAVAADGGSGVARPRRARTVDSMDQK